MTLGIPNVNERTAATKSSLSSQACQEQQEHRGLEISQQCLACHNSYSILAAVQAIGARQSTRPSNSRQQHRPAVSTPANALHGSPQFLLGGAHGINVSLGIFLDTGRGIPIRSFRLGSRSFWPFGPDIPFGWESCQPCGLKTQKELMK